MSKLVLTGKQRFQLTQLIQADYATRNQTDTEYAVYASRELGFPVNENHIAGVRKEWEIPNASRANSETSLKQRIAELDAENTALEQRVIKLEEDYTILLRRFDAHIQSKSIHATPRLGG